MRDLIILIVVFGSVPIILMRAYVGVLIWSWLGYMNPHRLAWGFAYEFPFSQVAAIVTLAAIVFDKTKKSIPITSLTIVWAIFVVWLNLSTFTSMDVDGSMGEWDRTMKIMLFSAVTIILMQEKNRLNLLVVVITVSLGFYGVKGGIFTVLTGGNYRVFGPAESFFQDNNALALALIMTLPLVRYLHMQCTNAKLRWLIVGVMVLIGFAILASHSRGAFLAGGAMSLFLWWKGKDKIRTGIVILALLPIMVMQMPEHWFERMGTITTYEEDSSAMGRINAWWFAFNLAKDHPFFGGGFSAFSPELFEKYAPIPEDFHDSHSIYFEVMAEQGFGGLALFLGLGFLSLRTASKVIKRAAPYPELAWSRELAAMIQVSLVGYAVGGAFLGLAYFDLYYHLVAMIVALHCIVTRHSVRESATVQGKQLNVTPSNRNLAKVEPRSAG